MKKGFWVTVRDIIKRADVILEVLDARFPNITRVTQLEKMAKNYGKKVIIVVNKTDILSLASLKKVKEEYKHENCVFVSAKKSRNILDLIRKIKESSKSEVIKVAIVGYPNTGKSSLINRLSRGARAKTSSESGYTRGKQLIKGKGNIMLMDTPGVVPYKARDEVLLGLVSGISPQKLEDPDVVALELLNIFSKNNPKVVKDAYGVDIEKAGDDILEILGEKWGMLLKKGVIDENRAAVRVLEDWHKGKIRL